MTDLSKHTVGDAVVEEKQQSVHAARNDDSVMMHA